MILEALLQDEHFFDTVLYDDLYPIDGRGIGYFCVQSLTQGGIVEWPANLRMQLSSCPWRVHELGTYCLETKECLIVYECKSQQLIVIISLLCLCRLLGNNKLISPLIV